MEARDGQSPDRTDSRQRPRPLDGWQRQFVGWARRWLPGWQSLRRWRGCGPRQRCDARWAWGHLGGMLGGGGLPGGLRTAGTGGAGGRNAMLALMLPLVLQWVQRSGGIGNVLQRVNQQGYGGHANSWVGTGANQPLPPQAAQQLLGPQELSTLSSQLGVGEDEVAHGFTEILPEVVDQLSPQGELPADADNTLDAGQSALSRMLGQLS